MWVQIPPGPFARLTQPALNIHPLDTVNRTEAPKNDNGIAYCNITKCCTSVCPEHVTITDNAIIPLRERVADEFYDPLTRLLRTFPPKGSGTD